MAREGFCFIYMKINLKQLKKIKPDEVYTIRSVYAMGIFDCSIAQLYRLVRMDFNGEKILTASRRAMDGYLIFTPTGEEIIRFTEQFIPKKK